MMGLIGKKIIKKIEGILIVRRMFGKGRKDDIEMCEEKMEGRKKKIDELEKKIMVLKEIERKNKEEIIGIGKRKIEDEE